MTPNLITLAHGGGGIRTRNLIKDLFLKYFRNPVLEKMDDSACLQLPESALAFTTDSYVVNPIFFPGGDIGKLAVCGTINDLAMQGAEPKYLSLGMILEEGLPISDLEKIVRSMGKDLEETGAILVAGDTKVVEHTNGFGLFINTSGIGIRQGDFHVANAKPDNVIILTGTMGDHGIAVMGKREGLKFESTLKSDVAQLWGIVSLLMKKVPSLCCMRDPTRGGVAAALCDIAESSQTGIRILEPSLPIRKEVRGACGLLGLDPLDVANEGKALLVCSRDDAGKALKILHAHPLGRKAAVIGSACSDHTGIVVMETHLGGERIIETPDGENLPRIC